MWNAAEKASKHKTKNFIENEKSQAATFPQRNQLRRRCQIAERARYPRKKQREHHRTNSVLCNTQTNDRPDDATRKKYKQLEQWLRG